MRTLLAHEYTPAAFYIKVAGGRALRAAALINLRCRTLPTVRKTRFLRPSADSCVRAPGRVLFFFVFLGPVPPRHRPSCHRWCAEGVLLSRWQRRPPSPQTMRLDIACVRPPSRFPHNNESWISVKYSFLRAPRCGREWAGVWRIFFVSIVLPDARRTGL